MATHTPSSGSLTAMCGRFTQRLLSADFARLFGARDLLESAGEAYNVAPAQRVAVVAEREEERLLGPVAELLVPGRELAARKWERWQGCVTQSRLTARAPARGARQGVVVAPSDGFSPPPQGGADGWLGSTGPLQPAQ